jgi:hypothetical protein
VSGIDGTGLAICMRNEGLGAGLGLWVLEGGVFFDWMGLRSRLGVRVSALCARAG